MRGAVRRHPMQLTVLSLTPDPSPRERGDYTNLAESEQNQLLTPIVGIFCLFETLKSF